MKVERMKEGLPLTEYLQIEQDLVKGVTEPTLFTWIVSPTVIYGRHQSAEAEVNEDYCREHGIAVVQRKSGGGCVYADRGNLMISLVSPSTHSEQVFAEYLSFIAQALLAAGLPAVTTEHNDILVDGRKVSGCACFAASTGTIVHGTLLYDVNLEALQQAITPSPDKLHKHGVASVRQRVANIKELTDAFADIHALRAYIEEYGDKFTCTIDA
ncbi:MAG: lipoate--protein ligase family protein [Paludibacteraceae bacterium]|nr:lipoate--protein ligase family protein [Paludibacteraceae bacterium]